MEQLKRCEPDLYVQSLPGHDAAKYLRMKCSKMRVLIVGGLLDDERLQYREALQGFEVFPQTVYLGGTPAKSEGCSEQTARLNGEMSAKIAGKEGAS